MFQRRNGSVITNRILLIYIRSADASASARARSTAVASLTLPGAMSARIAMKSMVIQPFTRPNATGIGLDGSTRP